MPHPPKVLGGKPLHPGKLPLEIAGQVGDDGLAPSGASLAFTDHLPDVPIEADELLVDRF